jgi:catechol 2,3-dioxygenase-like lactoylglutathione lyase family enzyme
MIRGIHHTSLATKDADRLLTFYRDLLGLQQLWDVRWEQGTQPELAKVVGMKDAAGRTITLRAGNAFVEIFEYSSPTPGECGRRPACDVGVRHICFDVVGIEAEHRRLSDAGIEFVSDPQVLPGVKSTYGYDPDGNIFELQEILPHSIVPPIPFEPTTGNGPQAPTNRT